jgi:hypothetical protein
MKILLANLISMLQWAIGAYASVYFITHQHTEENAVWIAVSFCLSLLISVPFYQYTANFWEEKLNA